MSRDIKDYLHYYLGQECIAPGHLRVKFVGVIYRDGESWPQLQEFKNGRHHGPAFTVSWDQIKPILRKLESMTEEESSELNDAMWGGFPDAWQPVDETLKMFLHPWDSEYRPAFPVYVKATNWLRSKGFDCDELIESGLAIDKETLNR